MIYLDSAATTLEKPGAVPRASAWAMTHLASPGRGGHAPGMGAAKLMYDMREQAARLFHMGDPEQVVLTCMSYMAVLSAALAIRRRSHIRMTALDPYLPKGLVKFLDILADVAVLALALIMIVVGWRYATGLGAKGNYVSMPKVSRFWMYFPVPLAGVAMLVFELEALYGHVKGLLLKEEVEV